MSYTGKTGSFYAMALEFKLQKTMRYSFQRTFTEVYKLDCHNDLVKWMDNKSYAKIGEVDIDFKYLMREVPKPVFEIHNITGIIEKGTAEKIDHKKDFKYISHRFINNISDTISGYKLDEIKEKPFYTIQDYAFNKLSHKDTTVEIKHKIIGSCEYVIFDMGKNNNGFILSEITALKDSEIYFIFDEKLVNNRIDINSWQSLNVIKYDLKKSSEKYKLASFETYGFKYIMCFVRRGCINLHLLQLREYSYPFYSNVKFQCDDEIISRIYSAAVETYRQNTLDIFMDCPTRERAGWLCDSYFTSQAEQYFSGESIVEKVMIENYLLPKDFPFIPNGMLPMCYPADHPDGNFIPQWAMWYVIELEEYFKRNPLAEKETFRDLCYRLISYFKQYENEYGLLENLDKWNFIEWSDANNWTQDVNYPTNMLYSKLLMLMGEWYYDNSLIKKSIGIKKHIVDQSFNGIFFIDNAVRDENGKLMVTDNKSEVCQYYALFFDIAVIDDNRFDELRNTVVNIFGPDRKQMGILPDVAYANAFIGNYLRMMLLLRWGFNDQAIREVKEYFNHMANTSGTLWEHDSISGSLNHGFASFAGVVIIKSMLGIREIDTKKKRIIVDFNNIYHSASGKIGVSNGNLFIKHKIVDEKIQTTCMVPDDMILIELGAKNK